MVRLAVTGHRGLPRATVRLVDRALRREIAAYPTAELVGLSCLADGADALFAQAVLDHGGSLTVVVPAAGYREGLPAQHHETYDGLFLRATRVIAMDRVESDSQAHLDGSLRMLAEADRLLAVWDGQPARGYGGTADVVHAARRREIPVTVVWPEGACRQ